MIESFSPVSLEELERRAQVLTRFNKKYILPLQKIATILASLEQRFDILEINGNRHFSYETFYFDDDNASSYYDHHQGRRKRFKIRTRRYLDSKSCYLEVKLKYKRGCTVKRRMAYPAKFYGTLNQSAISFIKAQHLSLYGEEFDAVLTPSINMYFSRVTLIGKQGGERLTLDSDIRFCDGGKVIALPSDLLILEVKSAAIRGLSHRLLQQHHLHPIKRCSKYCIGMAMSGKVEKKNKFRSALSKFSHLPDISPRSQFLEPLQSPLEGFSIEASKVVV